MMFSRMTTFSLSFLLLMICFGCGSLSGGPSIPSELREDLNSSKPILVEVHVKPALVPHHSKTVHGIMKRIMEAAGKPMVTSGTAPHGATITFDMSGQPLGANYQIVGSSGGIGGYQYSGAQIRGVMTIHSDPATPYSVSLNSYHPPPQSISGTFKVTDAPYHLALDGGFKLVLYNTFSHIYGQKILVTLSRINQSTTDLSAMELLENLILQDDLSLLINSVNATDPLLQVGAVHALAYMVRFSKNDRIKKIIINSEELMAALNPVLSHANPEIRSDARVVLRKAGVRLPIGTIRTDLKDQSSSVRHEAVKALGPYPDDQVMDLLAAALKDPDPAVRWVTVIQFWKRKNPKSVPFLIDVVENDKNDTAVGYAVKALGDLKDSRATQPIIHVMKTRGKRFGDIDRSDCAKALAKIGDPESVNAIISLFDQGPEHVDGYNIFPALGEFGGYQVIDFLIRLHPKISNTAVAKVSINDVLTQLTGQKFESDSQKWEHWWEENKLSFQP